MNEKNTGGGAFPQPATADGYRANTYGGMRANTYGGMSLRDYFAAKALIAIIGHGDIFTHEEHSDVARWAYGYSDAMLEERNK